MHNTYSTLASSTTCSLIWTLLLVAHQQLPLQCNCVLLALGPDPDAAVATSQKSAGCAISTALLRQMGDCSNSIPESQFSLSVQSAWGPDASSDSLHNTEFTYDDNGHPTGSFELSHSLRPSDSLLIQLAGRYGHDAPTCQTLVLCNLSVGGPAGQRLRLNLSLKVDNSYEMKIMKLTNSSVMCEQPQLAFFHANAKASADPQIQLAVKRCENCGTAGAPLTCRVDIYLRPHDMARAWSLVRAQSHGHGEGNGYIDFSNQTSANSRNGWLKHQVSGLRVGNEFLLVRFFSSSKIPVYTPRFNFFIMKQSGGSFQDQLCQTAVSPCPSAQTPLVQLGLLLGFSLAAVTAMAAATLVWSCCRPRLHRHILLVLPDAASVADVRLRRCPAVAAFRRELLATDAVKRGRLSVREVAGLRSLTPALARDSRLIIFLSDDPAFSCFSLDSLSGEVSLALKTVVTEKSRTRGLFVTSGQPPPAASDWALLAAQQLGDNGVEPVLMALSRDAGV